MASREADLVHAPTYFLPTFGQPSVTYHKSRTTGPALEEGTSTSRVCPASLEHTPKKVEGGILNVRSSIATAVALALALVRSASGQEPQRITGQVTDQDSKFPIPSVRVSV